MRIFTATENDDGRRVDAFLCRLMPGAPKSLIYKYMRTGKIKVGGKKPKPETRLSTGDEIKYFGDEALLSEKKVPEAKKTGDVTVLYEDEHILLLYKPPLLASQPDKVHTSDTLCDRMVSYLIRTGAFSPQKENGFTPAICNRLDFNTHGIVVGAKTLEGLRKMNEMIRKGRVRKFYLCRVVGTPNPPEGRITGALEKDTKTNISRVSENGKRAETGYKLLQTEGKTSLLEVELFTGRSHQIRVHMKSIGCPLAGDPKYGTGGKGQALCAYKIRFDFDEEGALGGVSGKTFTLPKTYTEKI